MTLYYWEISWPEERWAQISSPVLRLPHSAETVGKILFDLVLERCTRWITVLFNAGFDSSITHIHSSFIPRLLPCYHVFASNALETNLDLKTLCLLTRWPKCLSFTTSLNPQLLLYWLFDFTLWPRNSFIKSNQGGLICALNSRTRADLFFFLYCNWFSHRQQLSAISCIYNQPVNVTRKVVLPVL